MYRFSVPSLGSVVAGGILGYLFGLLLGVLVAAVGSFILAAFLAESSFLLLVILMFPWCFFFMLVFPFKFAGWVIPEGEIDVDVEDVDNDPYTTEEVISGTTKILSGVATLAERLGDGSGQQRQQRRRQKRQRGRQEKREEDSEDELPDPDDPEFWTK